MAFNLSESPSEDQLKLNPDQESLLINSILRDWETSNSSRSKAIKDMEEGLNLYYGIRRAKDFPFKNCANLHVPLIRTIADTLHSNVMGSLDTVKPASITPVGPEDMPKARKVEQLLNWQFSTQIDYTDLTDKVIHSTLIYRSAPVKIRYLIERDSEGKKTYDGLKADVLPVERFLIPPDSGSSSIQDMDFVIQEIPMTKSDLKRRMADKKNGWNRIPDDELDRCGISGNRNEREDNSLSQVRDFYVGSDPLGHIGQPNKKYATVLEWYGYFDHDKDGVDEPVMALILKDARKILKVCSWKRLRPFALIKFSDVLHKGHGESVPDILKSLNQELNIMHNQTSDALTLRNVPFFFFDPVAGFNPNEITLAPGVGIPVQGSPSQAVYFPSMNTNMPEMFQTERLLFEYAERLLGAGANTQGITNTKRMSATEIASMDRRAGIRFLTIFNRIRKGLREVFKVALELDREFMPPEIQVRINGIDASEPVFETVTRDALEAQLDIMINGNSILDDQAEKQDMMAVYNIGVANPLVSGNPMAFHSLTRDLFIKLGIKKVDAYVPEPEDLIPHTPNEEHNIFLQGEYIGPHAKENIEKHLDEHAAVINDPKKFRLFDAKGQAQLIKHFNETLQLKSSIERFMLLQQAMQVNQTLMQSQTTGTIPPEAMGLPRQVAQSPIAEAQQLRGQ